MISNKIKDLTCILACKNRNRNLKYCLESINANKKVPQVILVDFGNNPPLEATYPWMRTIRVTKDTEKFHKARAINIGIKSLKTRYVCITDVDQIFQPNFFAVVSNVLNRYNNCFVLCWTYRLNRIPRGLTEKDVGEKYNLFLAQAKKDTKRLFGDGCCHATTTKWIKATRGYEESFIGWGPEDSDMTYRAHWVWGKKLINIRNRTSMIHLPHPKRINKEYYDSSVRDRNIKLYKDRRNSKTKVANAGKEWGKL